jgi:hypothetical protein
MPAPLLNLPPLHHSDPQLYTDYHSYPDQWTHTHPHSSTQEICDTRDKTTASFPSGRAGVGVVYRKKNGFSDSPNKAWLLESPIPRILLGYYSPIFESSSFGVRLK